MHFAARLGHAPYLFLASVALSPLALWPIIPAGLAGDDPFRDQMAAYAAMHHLDRWHGFVLAAAQLAREHGGFFPLRAAPLGLWTLAPSVVGMKLLGVSLVALNVATFALLGKRLARSSALA